MFFFIHLFWFYIKNNFYIYYCSSSPKLQEISGYGYDNSYF